LGDADVVSDFLRRNEIVAARAEQFRLLAMIAARVICLLRARWPMLSPTRIREGAASPSPKADIE
jgi:hypothetical protein